jgi:hypothetical protein
MSEAKFTPGPWEIDPRVSTRVRDQADTTIASAGMASRVLEEAQANAHLIAASPLGFALAEEIVGHLYDKQDIYRIRAMAQEFLLKAVGI